MARPKKAQRFTVQPFRNTAGTKSWRVSGTKANGERVRKNFTEKAAAFQALADLETEMDGHTTGTQFQRTRLSNEEIATAESAVLSAPGRNIAAIVTHYLALEVRAQEKGIDLNASLAFVESHYRSEIKTISVLNAQLEFLKNRSVGSEKTQEHYESSLKLLLKADPNKHVHRFTVSDIEKLLAGYKNLNSKRTYRRVFNTFFNWCVRHHYCMENPCSRLDKLPKDTSQIAALSLDEAKRLLRAAMEYQDGAAAAVVAIGLFAGLRPSEIRDLKPQDILMERIRVSGGKMRRVLKRSVPIPPALAQWLKEYPFIGLPKGWDAKIKTLKNATKAKKWVQDIIRHTSITFQAERDKNEALTAYNNGTSKQMMDRHYRDLVDDEKTVAEFWELTPESIRSAKLDVELPIQKRVAWPTKAKLTKLVWAKPMMHAAKTLGVSDVALRKRCLSIGIVLPKQGHWIKHRFAE